ncbi:Kazal-type serine protease inhibitor domain-containing protein [Aminobacter sp. AP02]|uniref:Kazal-type serine protease inhibitor domain-containing protein n=1 Tax=Aminobacter sp. AP02 TaxID=2135737 RepID=UPI000D6C29AF|nr:Kazal-type serine protease inhibitor domain-containing protein [Aminobacter sp. AP02]PWK63919.1 Kazal-type serine protease inhibitor-like protein [Aminobacter sp. AP02]
MTFSARILARKATVSALLSVMLASCVVVEEGPGPRPLPPRPGPGPQFCTREYDPVCASRGSERQTFGNACMAEAAGFRIIRGGECRGGGDTGWNGGGGGWNGGGGSGGWNGGGGGNEQFCTMEYRPVCGRRGGTLRTFSNSCQADAAGFRVVDQGSC